MHYKGQNRAILQKSAYKSFAESYEPISKTICIFLSHISIDKTTAIAIGDYITKAGIDIYLDIYDDDLQKAVRNGDARKITEYIETGIDFSSHIFCIVSEETVKSWWVPYELGFGKKGKKEIATLTLKNTSTLPAYLQIGKIIRGTLSLNEYIENLLKGNYIKETYLYKSSSFSDDGYLLKASKQAHPLDPYLDWRS